MLQPIRSISRSMAIATLALTLVACSNGPGGRRSPPGGAMGGPSPAGGAAPSGPVARPVALLIASFDADADMVVTRGEADQAIKAEWIRLSGDRPTAATLTLADWLIAALGSADAQPSTVAFDNNFDGVISRDEFETRLRSEFIQLDKNDDGVLSRAELIFELPDMRGGGRSGGGGSDMGQRPQRGGGR